jgi:hypothetical protein
MVAQCDIYSAVSFANVDLPATIDLRDSGFTVLKIMLWCAGVWHHIAWQIRSRSKWGANIKVDSEEICWEGVDWIDLAQNRDRRPDFESVAMNMWSP